MQSRPSNTFYCTISKVVLLWNSCLLNIFESHSLSEFTREITLKTAMLHHTQRLEKELSICFTHLCSGLVSVPVLRQISSGLNGFRKLEKIQRFPKISKGFHSDSEEFFLDLFWMISSSSQQHCQEHWKFFLIHLSSFQIFYPLYICSVDFHPIIPSIKPDFSSFLPIK